MDVEQESYNEAVWSRPLLVLLLDSYNCFCIYCYSDAHSAASFVIEKVP